MKTIVIMVAIVASVFGMQSCAAQQQGEIDLKNAFLVDVRTPEEVAEREAKVAKYLKAKKA